MTVRNRNTRLLPDNPLGSILRENAREARRPRRRFVQGESGGGGGGTSDGGTGVAWDVSSATAGGDGTATVTFPEPLPGGSVPVVVATVECSFPAIATVLRSSATGTTVAAWTISGLPLEGVPIHVVTYPGRIEQ